jgi:hypothetical protein
MPAPARRRWSAARRRESGKIVWDLTTEPPIDTEAVEFAQEAVEAKLYAGLLRVRADRTTGLELRYLRAAVEPGSKPQQAKDVLEISSPQVRGRP